MKEFNQESVLLYLNQLPIKPDGRATSVFLCKYEFFFQRFFRIIVCNRPAGLVKAAQGVLQLALILCGKRHMYGIFAGNQLKHPPLWVSFADLSDESTPVCALLRRGDEGQKRRRQVQKARRRGKKGNAVQPLRKPEDDCCVHLCWLALEVKQTTLAAKLCKLFDC